VAALRELALPGGGDGFNDEVFHGKSASAVRILDAARTLPMMAARRFVLVRGIDGLSPSELDKLADYLPAPSPSTLRVMIADKLDGRARLAVRARKLGCLIEAGPLKPRDMGGFLQGEATRRGLKLSRDAGAALLDAVGTDLAALDDALERLSLYAGEGQRIELPAVEACVTKVRVETIWALVDAVSARDRKRALAAASSLLGDREPALRILTMVARQLRMVARMQAALARGLGPQDATREAGAPPFKAREMAAAARRFAAADLARAFAVLAETDLALKGSKRPDDIVLEHALLQLTG
jgi:DNA polymerase-3 subunit delta